LSIDKLIIIRVFFHFIQSAYI